MKQFIFVLIFSSFVYANIVYTQVMPISKPITGFETEKTSGLSINTKKQINSDYNFNPIRLQSADIYFYTMNVHSYFDIQSNSVPHTIWQDPFRPSNVHAVFIEGFDTLFFDRGVQYLFSSNSGVTWTPKGYVPVLGPDTKSGFPSIDGFSNGAALIANHNITSYPNNVRAKVYYDSGPGIYSFTELDPGLSQIFMWPVIISTSDLSHERKFVFAASDPATTGFINSCNSLTPPGIFSGYANYSGAHNGQYSLARSQNGNIGHAYIGHYENKYDAFFRASTDDGMSWSSPVKIWNWNINGDSLGVLMGISMVYLENTPVVTFNTMILNETSYFPGRPSQIRSWNPLVNNGIPVVAADSSNIPFYRPKTRISDDFTSLCRPSIGVSSMGNILAIAFSGTNGMYDIYNNDTNTYFSGFVTLSSNGGQTWYNQSRITPLSPLLDWRYMSVSKINNVTDDELTFQMVCQSDTKAGSFVRNNNGPGDARLVGIRMVIPLKTAPSTPILSSPQNLSSYVSVRPVFSWENVSNADSYSLQVSNDSLFKNLIFSVNEITATTYQGGTDFEFNTKYFWRIRATNKFGISEWSTVWNFRTATFLPPAPILISPANNSVEVSLILLLNWHDAPTAIQYHLQVSGDSSFASTLINISNLTDTLFRTSSGLLLYDSSYYWRVRSTNNNGTGEWSESRKFSTITTPVAPTLTLPPNNSTGTVINPLLRWNDVSNAIIYRVQVSEDSKFVSTIIDESLTWSQFQIALHVLNFHNLYYWRVRSTNEAGTSQWSEVWNFTTAVLSTPLLSSPINGATNISITPFFNWSDVLGASFYEIQITTDSVFNFIAVSQSELTSSQYSVALPGLLYDTNYFWRVRSIADPDTSEWTSVWKFRTRMPVNINLVSQQIPVEYHLYDNYPNPFNPDTKIRFDLPRSTYVEIVIFDVLGKNVSEKFSGYLSPGKYEYIFTSKELSSGIYFYNLGTKDFSLTKKMLLIR